LSRLHQVLRLQDLAQESARSIEEDARVGADRVGSRHVRQRWIPIVPSEIIPAAAIPAPQDCSTVGVAKRHAGHVSDRLRAGPGLARLRVMSFAFLSFVVCTWMLVALSASHHGGPDGISLKVRRERESGLPPIP
jgi:hypothetical protein